jgi:hypothetical protein
MCNCEEHEATLKEIFNEIGITDKITCAQAHDIVENYDITFEDISAYCGKHSVKIKNCQLGCF